MSVYKVYRAVTNLQLSPLCVRDTVTILIRGSHSIIILYYHQLEDVSAVWGEGEMLEIMSVLEVRKRKPRIFKI